MARKTQILILLITFLTFLDAAYAQTISSPLKQGSESNAAIAFFSQTCPYVTIWVESKEEFNILEEPPVTYSLNMSLHIATCDGTILSFFQDISDQLSHGEGYIVIPFAQGSELNVYFFMARAFLTGQISKFLTALACVWINDLRGATSSPIKISKMWSASAASRMLTRNNSRCAGSMVVSQS